MGQEKIFLILGIIIVLLLVLNVYTFFKKNKDTFKEFKKNKSVYVATVIDKRHYTENNHNLFYVTFSYNELEKEFLVTKFLFNEVKIGQVGSLTIKNDYFYDFK